MKKRDHLGLEYLDRQAQAFVLSPAYRIERRERELKELIAFHRERLGEAHIALRNFKAEYKWRPAIEKFRKSRIAKVGLVFMWAFVVAVVIKLLVENF